MESKRTKSVLATAIGSMMAMSAHAEIVISQYVEGSSYNKAVEIANTGSETVTLNGYSIARQSNGGTWQAATSLESVTISAGDVYVIAHSGANSDILAVTDLQDNSVANFNGNDAIGLYLNDELVDVVGVVDSDESWGENQTLVRYHDALTPTPVFNASQWASLAQNNIDGLGSLDDVEALEAFTCTLDGSAPSFTAIQDIQGEGATSPLIPDGVYITDEEYFVEGVVSAVTTGLTRGFYLQALSDDGNPLTSEGLFVYTGQTTSDLEPGDVVCAKGQVQEYYNLTQLSVGNNQWVVESQQSAPQAQPIEVIESDQSFADTLERYEGMLVSLPQSLDMRVTRTFSYDYDASRNNMVVAQGQLNYQPNQHFAAGSAESLQASADNADRRLFVESDQRTSNATIPYYPDFGLTDADQDGSTEDYIRVDDTLVGAEGVISYSYDEYRLIVTNQLDSSHFVHNSPRTEAPNVSDDGDLRIASFNVLNYFNSPFGGDSNQFGSNRGAESYEEFEVQQAKIVAAIAALDADIVGLMEIENNGFGDSGAIRQLVEQLNAVIDDPEKQYQFVAVDSNGDGVTNEEDSVGTDAISVGVIYRSSVVSLSQSRVIAMPEQHAPAVVDSDGDVIEDGVNYQRDTLAPSFTLADGSQTITVAVNHLKSKGSTCWEDAAPESEGGQGGEDPDFQGSCENFRVAGAVALGDALANIDGYKVLLGDMNAYAKEDPILVLTDYSAEKYGKEIRAARNTSIDGQEQFGDEGAVISQNYGYINAVELFHDDSWSYSYNDEVGTLDHLLISPSLEAFVVDAGDWHINAAESTVFDYSDDYKGDGFPKYRDQFRASDHDPAVLELRFSDSDPDEEEEVGSFGLGLILSLASVGLWRRRRGQA
ncbi:ExeM/NucH family extracellular endonuclease [Vibrio olivae]|uniref:ExeM/NucH family extracellular endonuclease n=1 Tax=Vibrio olivae TaxID=1243002 RepID=A0ABV5HQF5_9VIBR